ncbi:MAG: DUF4034 domain-containing protein [Hyphomicrobiaceae bacterium]
MLVTRPISSFDYSPLHRVRLTAIACCALALSSAVAVAQNATVIDPGTSIMASRMRDMFRPEPTPNTHYRSLDGEWSGFVMSRLVQDLVDVSLDFETACEHAMAPQSTVKDGSLMIHHYIISFAEAFSGIHSPNAWPITLKKINAWRAAYPQSKCAPLVEAKYWRTFAWFARGGGYSDSVEKEGWALFGERVQKSYDVAMESKSLAASNPVWFSTVILAALDLQMPMADITRIVAQSIKQHPNYWETSFNVSTRLHPKWGASWKDHEAFVRSASNLAAPAQRDEIYARHFWKILEMGELRDYSAMDWNRVKAGMKFLIAKLPEDTRYLNAYAIFACGANDGDAYSFARLQIKNNQYAPIMWARGMTMEVCDRRFKLDKPL